MKYITKKQLDKEIAKPLVKTIRRTGSIQKFIVDHSAEKQVMSKEFFGYPQRPIITKAFILSNDFITE